MDHSTQNLTQRDGELLNNLFALDQNLFSLAAHESLPLHELIAWSQQPHIHAAIDHITKLLEAGHKAAAIAHLRHTADTIQDPIERRRACTTLLRAMNQPAANRAGRGRQILEQPLLAEETHRAHPSPEPRNAADTAAAQSEATENRGRADPVPLCETQPAHDDHETRPPRPREAAGPESDHNQESAPGPTPARAPPTPDCRCA